MQQEPTSFSGIYPHLAMFNAEDECGTGAVVPWANRLWVITYAPHKPEGSSDKLYEITNDLTQIIRPESIGGTPANRMIHKESNQLFIGPYAIDATGKVRVIPYSKMFGRPTGTARHLSDPANKLYIASMEEALYEVDVHSLEVRTLFYDTAVSGKTPKSNLPGYHGKGLYTGQGRVIYSNNGENGDEAKRNPFIPSGALAEWDGADWRVVLRNQFTEVTGPGGIYGNALPETDPVWSIGWDAKSLILMLLEGGKWHRFRLPKASHSYDGAHGWNTEWPRIRDIGEQDLLMTMHGMFWRFPKNFRSQNTKGILPRSTYLKVIGDFCKWQEKVVFGCDDTAKNEFLNKRKAKGNVAAPQSQSNLWFVEQKELDRMGTVMGRGAVWWRDDVPAKQPSDPYLFNGFDLRGLHLSHKGETKAVVTVEVDRNGNGKWSKLVDLTLGANEYRWYEFNQKEKGVWIRLQSNVALKNATAYFHFRAAERRPAKNAPLFDGLAKPHSKMVTGGVLLPRSDNKRTLHFAAIAPDSSGSASDIGLYELDAQMKLRKVDDPQQHTWLKANAAIPSRKGVLETDDASVLYIDDSGQRFRLPKNDALFDQPGLLGFARLDREVATERDLFHCHGTFFELPAENAGGFRRVRPISTHNLAISDYCSYRGLLVISGVNLEAAGTNRHIIRSDDGKTGLWVGAIDDIWKMGKPRGHGGPWRTTKVRAGVPSDPYLFGGYDRKTIHIETTASTTILMELDVTGTGDWQTWKRYVLPADGNLTEKLPDALQAYWVRFRSVQDTTATVQLNYE